MYFSASHAGHGGTILWCPSAQLMTLVQRFKLERR
jgi:hypothetical protein